MENMIKIKQLKKYWFKDLKREPETKIILIKVTF